MSRLFEALARAGAEMHLAGEKMAEVARRLQGDFAGCRTIVGGPTILGTAWRCLRPGGGRAADR
ncbi:MAG TPA: hypothetical protein VNN77_09410 [candidate division Zixibacteria bacterium]|nr:hypothetical protein [candidate division Zixibacteria bacterium]